VAAAVALIALALIIGSPDKVKFEDLDRGYGKGFDKIDEYNLFWEDIITPTGYKQIVENSPFKLGEKKPDLYDDDDESYMAYAQYYGTYPLIDGSTVCIPMATEFARQHLNIDLETALGFTEDFSTTHDAYMSFIGNSVNYSRELSNDDYSVDMDNMHACDLILGTEPSDAELDYAKSKNVRLYKEPVCLDAFVFIVNKDNPVDSLTVEQIRGIYSGKITNWSEVGGSSEAILPFQRNAGSGSQTGMENLVMKGEKMIPALEHTIYSSMDGLVDAVSAEFNKYSSVAEYDNGKASIGYSYKYFVDTIYKNDNIKIISVDGTAPSAENVRSGKYPFSTYYYGVIRDEDREKTGGKFLDWILSEEGQKCVAQAGYITLK
jgi:phosphate transport system substrate-binding protein